MYSLIGSLIILHGCGTGALTEILMHMPWSGQRSPDMPKNGLHAFKNGLHAF